MRRLQLWIFVATLVASLPACTGQPIPTTAQQGSTIVLPFANSELPPLLPLTEVAYGGSEHADPQRGTLVVHLGDENGEALQTRLAFAAAPNVAAPLGPSGGPQGPNVLLVVDIPPAAPLGTHEIVVVRERMVQGVLERTVVTPSPQVIEIIPGSIDVALPGGGIETIQGASTPLQFWGGPHGWQPIDAPSLAGVLPEPSFGLIVSTPSWKVPAGEPDPGRFVAYTRATLSYPDDVIDVVRVVAREPVHGMVWWEDDGAGTLTLYGLTGEPEDTATGVGPFRVVFRLDDADAALLDVADVQVLSFEAFDQAGSPTIQGDWSLAAQVMPIR